MAEVRLVAMTEEQVERLQGIVAHVDFPYDGYPELLRSIVTAYKQGITKEEARVSIDELDAMGHSVPGQHSGPVDERCPACDALDKLRVTFTQEPNQ